MEGATSSMRVLVVEDNPMNLELTTDILESEGYVVIAATCGHDAINWLRSAKPDLVLMDVQLPGMDGLTVTKLIKADQATRHIPIIALTAHAMQGDAETMCAAGCDDYVSKPIEVNQFRKMLARYAANIAQRA